MLAFQKLFSSVFEYIGNGLLSPFSNEKIELIMVMIIIPFICNILQFWVIDNILKFNPSNREEMEMLKDGEQNLEKKDDKKDDQKNEIELS